MGLRNPANPVYCAGMADRPTHRLDTLAAIRARRAELRQVIESAASEDKDLEVAERVVARIEASGGTHTASISVASVNGKSTVAVAAIPQAARSNGTVGRLPGHAGLVIQVLRASTDPWIESASALHDEIQRLHGVDIKKTSLQPLLWRLDTQDKLIVRESGRIALAERASRRPETRLSDAKLKELSEPTG
jgi:hypothetical protein